MKYLTLSTIFLITALGADAQTQINPEPRVLPSEQMKDDIDDTRDIVDSKVAPDTSNEMTSGTFSDRTSESRSGVQKKTKKFRTRNRNKNNSNTLPIAPIP